MPQKHKDRLALLVRLLEEKTQQSTVFWEATGQEGKYRAAFGTFAVTVHKRLQAMDEKAQEDVVVGIEGEEGKQLDAFTDLEIESSLSDAYERMVRIYQLARRQALGVDEAIESIIAQLNDTLDFRDR